MAQIPTPVLFDVWAESYDATPNPLLLLGERSLDAMLRDVDGLRIIDAGSGTGRRLRRLRAAGAVAVGFDWSREMLARSSSPAARADLRAPCFRAESADLVLCAFSLAYAPESLAALVELVKPDGRLILCDAHPDRGWSRGFPGAEIAAGPWQAPAEMTLEQRLEPAFAERDRASFGDRRDVFEQALGAPALRLDCWRKTR